jgi:hypothetical protein
MNSCKESLAKAREIVYDWHGLYEIGKVEMLDDLVLMIATALDATKSKDPGLLVEALELISIMDSPMGFAGCPALARTALDKWKGE